MGDTQEIRDKVKAFILREFLEGEDPSALGPTTQLVSSGILDSIATLKLVAWLEKEFGIGIAAHEADAQNLDTLDQITQLVASKR
ncbi:MAG TPA: acyl carrier protein [Candidatus Eisenbacteria bacterium]|nr:acyl carrier protein [Candidatus Eisenbacteria bacterium]